jgi:hypothetical protein
MIGVINKWLEGAAKNHVLAIVWAIFVACFWYEVSHYEQFDEKVAELGTAATQIQTLEGEIALSRKLVQLWEATFNDASERLSSFSKLIEQEGLKPENIRTTTVGLLAVMQRNQLEIAKSMGTMKNVYFSLPSLQELSAKLTADLTTADEITTRRIEFVQAVLADMNRAREMVPSIIGNADEQRRVIEGDLRREYATQIDERARRETNDRIREYNARRATFHREGIYSTLALGYMGACLGGCAGWLLRRRRLKRRKRKKGGQSEALIGASLAQDIQKHRSRNTADGS